MISQFEIRIRRVCVKPCKMGTHILDVSRYWQFFTACSTAHFMPSFEHSCLKPSPGKITCNNCRMVSASNYHCIIFSVWHIYFPPCSLSSFQFIILMVLVEALLEASPPLEKLLLVGQQARYLLPVEPLYAMSARHIWVLS